MHVSECSYLMAVFSFEYIARQVFCFYNFLISSSEPYVCVDIRTFAVFENTKTVEIFRKKFFYILLFL